MFTQEIRTGMHPRLERHDPVLVVLATLWLSACTEPARPVPLGPEVSTHSICQAATRRVGDRIRVRGQFDGFDYGSPPRSISIVSDELCNDHGAGIVFAKVWSRTEEERASNLRPVNGRRQRPGDPVTMEGVITQIREGRFTDLEDAIIVR